MNRDNLIAGLKKRLDEWMKSQGGEDPATEEKAHTRMTGKRAAGG